MKENQSRKRSRYQVAALRAIGATAATTLVGIAFAPVASASDTGEPSHAAHGVFLMTNNLEKNEVVAYARDNDGRLTQVASYETGGKGAAQDGAVVDPLASQGALTYDATHRLLFAVNAGSDTVTVFQVDGTHLWRQQVLGTEGHLPTSVSVQRNLVYVLDAANEGAITGFRIGAGGWVEAIPDSTRSLGLSNGDDPNFLQSPAQVAITPNLRDVVVTTKANGTLDVFRLNRWGVPDGGSVTNPSAGPVPFSMTFDRHGHLLVSEASGAASSYRIERSGHLVTISGHVTDGQAATCWSIFVRGHLYVANTGSGTITAYSVNAAGELALLGDSAVAATTGAAPVDMAASLDGRYVYQLATGSGEIDEFKVGSGGSLTPIGSITGLMPDNGAGNQGLAAD